ncbi:hypothetical protein PPERSA_11169 [Pseudocohnilembus persalinus]|uniref:Uncharacterized protein n=1 Tax=Pseudocohnilembus persalinus TaxID=266149 RepID=A0A0V0QZF0_PSEPJ|nr:hypothetical protein PPERSA_11169 [Pseudocohnilembus persalinus]|eukprot:KRX07620.1 hypothetical protein PPERSA_11169 [Pseudocohnilembus persalinus]
MEQNQDQQSSEIKIKAIQINLLGFVYKFKNEDDEQEEQKQKDQEQEELLKIALIQIEDRSGQSEQQAELYQDKYNVLTVKICRVNGHQDVSKSEKEAQYEFLSQKHNISFFSSCNFKKNDDDKWESIFICGGMEYVEQNMIENTFQPTGKMYKLSLEEFDGEKDEIYNLRIDTFSKDEFSYNLQLEQQRVGHGCIKINDEICILQGNKFEDFNLQNYKLNFKQDQIKLEEFPQLNLQRSRASYIPYVDEQGKQFILAIGGFQEYGSEEVYQKKQLLEIFDFEKQKWEPKQTKSVYTVPYAGSWGFQHPQTKKIYLVTTLKSGAIETSQLLEVKLENDKVNFKPVGDLITKRNIHKGIIKKNFHNDNYTIYIYGD